MVTIANAAPHKVTSLISVSFPTTDYQPPTTTGYAASATSDCVSSFRRPLAADAIGQSAVAAGA
jgi:hypothetical protein